MRLSGSGRKVVPTAIIAIKCSSQPYRNVPGRSDTIYEKAETAPSARAVGLLYIARRYAVALPGQMGVGARLSGLAAVLLLTDPRIRCWQSRQGDQGQRCPTLSMGSRNLPLLLHPSPMICHTPSYCRVLTCLLCLALPFKAWFYSWCLQVASKLFLERHRCKLSCINWLP